MITDNMPKPTDPVALDRLQRGHYRRLLGWAKQLPSTDPKFTGGRVALMTPIGSYAVEVTAAGDPIGPIRFEPSDGKLKGYSVGPLIIDDPDGPLSPKEAAEVSELLADPERLQAGVRDLLARTQGMPFVHGKKKLVFANLAGGVKALINEVDDRRAKILGGAHRWECPCGASHDRGAVDGMAVHRCMKCGYVGEGGKVWDPTEPGPWREPIYLDVKVAAAAAAEHYTGAPVTPTLSIGNSAAKIEIPADAPAGKVRQVKWRPEWNSVQAGGPRAYFEGSRDSLNLNWLCCVRRDDGTIIKEDSGFRVKTVIPRFRILTRDALEGEAGDFARSLFFINDVLVGRIDHSEQPPAGGIIPYHEEEIREYGCLSDVAQDYEPGNPIYEAAALIFANTAAQLVRVNVTTGDVRPRYINPPVAARGSDPGAIIYDVQQAVAEAMKHYVGAGPFRPDFGLPPYRTVTLDAPVESIVIKFELEPSPGAELRAQLTEAGARMLSTCGTCKGTGGEGAICGTCRGSGSVAS